MPANLPVSGVPCEPGGPPPPTPYPGEGGAVIGPQNGVPPFQHASAMVYQHAKTAQVAQVGMFLDLRTEAMTYVPGLEWQIRNRDLTVPPPAAFTIDPAGRLVLVTGGTR